MNFSLNSRLMLGPLPIEPNLAPWGFFSQGLSHWLPVLYLTHSWSCLVNESDVDT